MHFFKLHIISLAYNASKTNGRYLQLLHSRLAGIAAMLLLLIICNMGFSQHALAHKDDADLSSLDQAISELLLDKIIDKRISLELSFNSNAKVEAINSKFNDIREIVLEKFDPKYSSFSVKMLYLDSSTDVISGKYFSFIEVPVAARYVRYNEIVQPSDLSSVSIRLDRIKRGIIVDAIDIIGKKSKKQIYPGNMFSGSDLITPPVININDPVNIVFSSGSINLKTTGVSLGSGIIGESIKVRNESSGAVLLGEIINKNTVKVGGN